MVIIQCEVNLKTDDFNILYDSLCKMARRGLILLPPYCELVNVVPPDTEVVVRKAEEVE